MHCTLFNKLHMISNPVFILEITFYFSNETNIRRVKCLCQLCACLFTAKKSASSFVIQRQYIAEIQNIGITKIDINRSLTYISKDCWIAIIKRQDHVDDSIFCTTGFVHFDLMAMFCMNQDIKLIVAFVNGNNKDHGFTCLQQ